MKSVHVVILEKQESWTTHLTTNTIHLYAPNWKISVIKKNYGYELNEIISSFKEDDSIIICKSGDQFEACFFTKIGALLTQPEALSFRGIAVIQEDRKIPFVFFQASGYNLMFKGRNELPFQDFICEDQLSNTEEENWMYVKAEEIGYAPSSRCFGWEKRREVEELILPIIQPTNDQIIINTMPIVTIGIATYQSSDTLTWTLRSIWNQTNPNWHLIVYDDGSTDSTSQVLLNIVKDSRVTVLRGKDNKGKSYACNQILAHTQSPWLLELDSDDWLAPNAVDCILCTVKQLEEHSDKHDKVHFLYGPYYLWEQGKMELRYRGIRTPPVWNDFERIIRFGTPICPRIFSTDLLSQIGGWSQEGPFEGRLYEDLELLYRMKTLYQVGTTIIPSPIYHRRVHRSSITHQVSSNSYQKWLHYIQKLYDNKKARF